MSGDDFVELVWENGQILMRDRLGRTFKVREWRSRYALYPSNAQAEDGGNMHRKRGRLENTYSTLKDSTSLDCRDSHDLNYFSDYDHDSLTGYHSESSPDLDQQLNLEANRSKTSDDKNSTHPRINIPGPDDANFKPSNASMFVGRLIPDQLATSRNCHLEPSSFHFQELDTLLGPREKNPSRTPESILAGLHTSNSLEHDLNPNTKTGTVMNFSYLRPEALLKASTPVFTRVQEVKSSNDERPPLGSRDPRESTIIGQASGSKRSATGPENQPEKELIPPVAETQDHSLPHDQHSEAFCRIRINLHNSHDQLPDQTSSASAANTPKGKPAVTSSSVCSLEASNDPTYSLRTHEDHTEESEYHLSPPISSALRSCPTLRQKVGEPECFKKQAPARSCGGCKRSSRTTEVLSLSEKRRREKVKEKMRVLKELIPNCDKVDKVSMLDEAIEYLKTLQLQLQIMSMGNNGAYNMPSIMLPAGMQHFMMNAVPHLTYFSPNMGAGMYVGMGCSPLYSPTSQIGATALPGITGNSIQLMHGFQGQPFPMPVSDASFLPSLGRLSAQSVQSGTAWPLSSLQDCSLTPPRDQKQECFV